MISKPLMWVGRIFSGLVVLFMIFDGVLKFFLDKLPPEALADSAKLGWSMDIMPTIGALALVCTTFYVIPRTSVIGAILLTGYFGGAIAAHVRIGNPLATHTLFPIYLALFMWAGLWLRDARVRQLLPIVRK